MLTIGLQHVGGDDWMGGTYYLHNLVKALRSLPREEQPKILIVLTSSDDRRHYEEIASIVDGFERPGERDAGPGPGSRSSAQSVKQALARSERLAYGVRRVKRALGRDVNHALQGRLEQASVSVLFPCIRSMGTGFGVPWLAWA